MFDVLITIAVWTCVALGACLGSRAMDRAFAQHGSYLSGPSPFPATPSS